MDSRRAATRSSSPCWSGRSSSNYSCSAETTTTGWCPRRWSSRASKAARCHCRASCSTCCSAHNGLLRKRASALCLFHHSCLHAWSRRRCTTKQNACRHITKAARELVLQALPWGFLAFGLLVRVLSSTVHGIMLVSGLLQMGYAS